MKMLHAAAQVHAMRAKIASIVSTAARTAERAACVNKAFPTTGVIPILFCVLKIVEQVIAPKLKD